MAGAFYDHLLRLDVYVIVDRKKNNAIAGSALNRAAHRVAYGLMRLRLEQVPFDDVAASWIPALGIARHSRKERVQAEYDRWRTTRTLPHWFHRDLAAHPGEQVTCICHDPYVAAPSPTWRAIKTLTRTQEAAGGTEPATPAAW